MTSGLHQCFYDLGRLQRHLGGGAYFEAVSELVDDVDLLRALEAKVENVDEFETKTFTSVFDFRFYRVAIYAIVRAMRPTSVIETGVLHGLTSAFILRALEQNRAGRLTSIDLPSYPDQGPANKDGYMACLPSGCDPGWVVPDSLRGLWDLHLGASADVLPHVLESLGRIDVFVHDSEHSYGTMWFELQAAWAVLSEGGILLCDNIVDNGSFFDFCASVARHPITFSAPNRDRLEALRFGVIVR